MKSQVHKLSKLTQSDVFSFLFLMKDIQRFISGFRLLSASGGFAGMTNPPFQCHSGESRNPGDLK
jgi:hypothetical protein